MFGGHAVILAQLIHKVHRYRAQIEVNFPFIRYNSAGKGSRPAVPAQNQPASRAAYTQEMFFSRSYVWGSLVTALVPTATAT